MSLDQGALIEPLAVAVYACERGGLGLGSNVLICGAGIERTSNLTYRLDLYSHGYGITTFVGLAEAISFRTVVGL